MPHLETPDELADSLADKLGVYGVHDDLCSVDPCRVCFVSEMTQRIRDAVANEVRLAEPHERSDMSGPAMGQPGSE